ncbi:hypothetical protein IWQ62_001821, partial [Dispira parvispora]
QIPYPNGGGAFRQQGRDPGMPQPHPGQHIPQQQPMMQHPPQQGQNPGVVDNMGYAQEKDQGLEGMKGNNGNQGFSYGVQA